MDIIMDVLFVNNEWKVYKKTIAINRGKFFSKALKTNHSVFQNETCWSEINALIFCINKVRNYFPVDIENIVQKSDTRFRKGCGAVFTTGEYDKTRLVALQEIKKMSPWNIF